MAEGETMERKTYCVYAGESAMFERKVVPDGAYEQVLGMDGTRLAGCMVTEAGWYKQDCEEPEMVAFESDRVIMFLGSDREHPNELNATIELWIENDQLTLTQSCAVFVPAHAAHGRISVKNLTAPVAIYSVQTRTDTFDAQPAMPSKPQGTFADHAVERFEPSNGRMPNAPEGLLTLIVWIDGGRIAEAPYAEAVWFNKNSDEGPEPHTHDYGEFLSFIGTDVEHPEDLGCEVEFYIDGKPITLTQSCLLYIPAGVEHAPFYIRNMVRPILHTSGYAGSEYQRN